jgi:Mor family transcriptional regulator
MSIEVDYENLDTDQEEAFIQLSADELVKYRNMLSFYVDHTSDDSALFLAIDNAVTLSDNLDKLQSFTPDMLPELRTIFNLITSVLPKIKDPTLKKMLEDNCAKITEFMGNVQKYTPHQVIPPYSQYKTQIKSMAKGLTEWSPCKETPDSFKVIADNLVDPKVVKEEDKEYSKELDIFFEGVADSIRDLRQKQLDIRSKYNELSNNDNLTSPEDQHKNIRRNLLLRYSDQLIKENRDQC